MITYEELLKNYTRFITIKANSMGQDPDTVKDLQQVAKIALFELLQGNKIDFDDNPHSYIITTLIGTMRNYLTKLGRTVRIPAHKVGTDADISTISINTSINENQTIEDTLTNIEEEDNSYEISKLKKAVNGLTEKHQEILHLRYNEAMTYTEIGQQLNLSHQASIDRHNAAIKILQQKYGLKIQIIKNIRCAKKKDPK